MKEKIKVLYANKGLRLSLYIIGALFILGIVFQVGVFVGYHKANFTRDWSNGYERNFGMNRPDSFRGMTSGRFPNPHGSSGKVLTVNLPNFVIEDNAGIEKNITMTAETIIRKGSQNSSSTIIKSGDTVMIIGTPNNQGQIEAKLIRVIPDGYSTSTNMYNMMFRR